MNAPIPPIIQAGAHAATTEVCFGSRRKKLEGLGYNGIALSSMCACLHRNGIEGGTRDDGGTLRDHYCDRDNESSCCLTTACWTR